MKADQPNAAQLEAHQARKERLARIAARAVAEPEAVKPVEVAPVEPAKIPEPEWVDRQKAIWFSIEAEILPKPTKPPSIDAVIEACAKKFGVTRVDLKSARRDQHIVVPRHVTMYLARILSLKSLPEIGRRLGGRDHTTVLSGIRRIEQRLRFDPDLAFDVAHIELCLEAV